MLIACLRNNTTPAGRPGWPNGPLPEALLEAGRVADSEAAGRAAQVFVPARPGFAAAVAGGVPAVAGDHRVGVPGIGVDADPAPFTAHAPAGQWAGRDRAAEELACLLYTS